MSAAKASACQAAALKHAAAVTARSRCRRGGAVQLGRRGHQRTAIGLRAELPSVLVAPGRGALQGRNAGCAGRRRLPYATPCAADQRWWRFGHRATAPPLGAWLALISMRSMDAAARRWQHFSPTAQEAGCRSWKQTSQ